MQVDFGDTPPDLAVADAMVRVYVAGPFRAKHALAQELNVRRAEIVSHAVFACGACAICPHSMTRFFQGSLPDQTWIDATLAMLLGCHGVLVLPGWRDSEGTRGEVAAANERGIPVEFLPGDFESMSLPERHYAVRAALTRIIAQLPALQYDEDSAPWPMAAEVSAPAPAARADADAAARIAELEAALETAVSACQHNARVAADIEEKRLALVAALEHERWVTRRGRVSTTEGTEGEFSGRKVVPSDEDLGAIYIASICAQNGEKFLWDFSDTSYRRQQAVAAGKVREAVEGPFLAEIARLKVLREDVGACWRLLDEARIEGMCPTVRLRSALGQLLELYSAVKAERDKAESELAALRQQLSILHDGETVDGVVMERDSYRIRLDHAEQDIAALRQPGVRVPVRLPDVEDVNGHLIKHNFSTTTHIEMAEALRFAAANATIDVPPGVPTLDELVDVGQEASAKVMEKIGLRESSKYDIAFAAAIRDRVIAALAPRPLPSREEVADQLSKSYYAYFGKEPVVDGRKESRFLSQADAVLALFAGCQPAPVGDGGTSVWQDVPEPVAPRPWTDDHIEALARMGGAPGDLEVKHA